MRNVAEGIFRLELPLPFEDLSTVNVFLVRCDDGWRLIDAGWSSDAAWEAFSAGLAEVGARASDIREIVLTHGHPDHAGLAGRIQRLSGATVLVHAAERARLTGGGSATRAIGWLEANGVPRAVARRMTAGRWMRPADGALHFAFTRFDGAWLRWGPHRLRVLPSPGHSPGLVCLYEAAQGVLFSSDHVLEHITSHIGVDEPHEAPALYRYVQSLERLMELPVSLVLPGHGPPFAGLASRVRTLLEHHRERADQALATLDGSTTAYTVASRLDWRGVPGSWATLDISARQLALTETIAHLELLAAHGQAARLRTPSGGRAYRATVSEERNGRSASSPSDFASGGSSK